MAVKISKSIPAFSAAVCWKAQRVLKMCSGVGRLVAIGVAMNGLSCSEMWTSQIIYAEALKTFLRGQADCPNSVRLAYSLFPATAKRQSMKREYHRWYSHRLGMELGVVVYGHWGSPLLGFPTSAGDEWELVGQSLISSLADFIDGGKLKFFTINSINGLSFYNKGAHPFHRSYVQSMFDSYLREEVVPFIWDNCQTQGIAISTMGASFGAYHAANTLFKHPDVIKRCFAMSGVYDMKKFMDGLYDDNFYFNNPVDYLANLNDPGLLEQLATCDIHFATGTGPWEDSGQSYRLSEVLASRGIRHSLDNWGPEGG